MPNPGLEANLRAGSSTCRKTRSKKRFWFPIHLAALGGSVEMVELLVETAPSAMTAPSFRLCGCVLEDLPRSPQEEREDYSDCCLPLHTAICHGHLDVVRWFLEHGPSLITTVAPSVTEATFKASATSNALHDAARVGRTDMIKFIWDRRSQLEFPHVDDHNDTLLSPLWLAFLSRQCLSPRLSFHGWYTSANHRGMQGMQWPFLLLLGPTSMMISVTDTRR